MMLKEALKNLGLDEVWTHISQSTRIILLTQIQEKPVLSSTALSGHPDLY